MKVKYNRRSSYSQNLDRQEVNSNSFDRVYSDSISGTVPFNDRPEAGKLIQDIEAGLISEVHVSQLDRAGRDILNLLTVIEYFNSKGVNLFVDNIGMYSLIDGKPNPNFKLIVSVLGNVAEMERSAMLERQRQGIEIAKAKGVYKGRLYGTKMTDEEILKKYRKVVKELKDGQSLRRAAKLGGCSLGTAQKVQRIMATHA